MFCLVTYSIALAYKLHFSHDHYLKSMRLLRMVNKIENLKMCKVLLDVIVAKCC